MGDIQPIVTALAAKFSGVSEIRLGPKSAIDQDMRMSGEDVWDFEEALADRFGDHVHDWPWHRFANLNEPSGLDGFVFLWRLLTWPIRGHLFDPSPYERLELGHIAAVIEKGQWFDP